MFALLVLAFTVGGSAGVGTVAAQGQREGVKVHGHWTIDVSNPDGTLVTHREFENSLITTGIGGGGTGLLGSWLARNAVPGGWAILLSGSACPAGPCASVEHAFVAIHFGTQHPQYIWDNLTTGQQGGTTSQNGWVGQVGPLLLTATVYAQASGTIQGVSTSNSQTLCLPNLDGSPGCTNREQYAEFSGTTLTDPTTGNPAPISVVAGQAILVTVVISFS
jgi:hypothetical protein